MSEKTEHPPIPGRGRFVARKLHSLSGVVPIGGFMLVHLYTNARALDGRAAFDEGVESIQRLPYLPILELAFVLLPLAFHALYGVKLALAGRPNAGQYPHNRNWMYVAQRVSGLFAFAFVVWHLSEYWLPRWTGSMDPRGFYPALCENLSTTRFGLPLTALGYVFGIAACSFHFSNGLWGFAASWGITPTRRSQRRSAVVFGVVGLFTFLLGANTAIYFATGSRIAVFGLPKGTRVAEFTRTCGDPAPQKLRKEVSGSDPSGASPAPASPESEGPARTPDVVPVSPTDQP